MNVVNAVILDIDGTLVDSNDAHALAWMEAFSKLDHHFSYEQIRPLIGKGGDKIIPELTGLHSESLEGRQITRLREEIFQNRHLLWVQPLPQVRDLLCRMKAEGLRIAVATSAAPREVKDLLNVAGVFDLIEAKEGAKPGEDSKPDPDVVAAALRNLGVPAPQVVYIGDTPYDVVAGRRAGVKVIALRCGGWTDEQLAGAAAIYDDPADLLAHYNTSPLAAVELQHA